MFANRTEAGQLLAQLLTKYSGTNSIVLAIPRGGVPVGYEVARALHLPLDIALAKKIGHPGNSEYAIGAVSPDSVVINEELDIPESYIKAEAERLQSALRQRQQLFRGNRPPIDLKNKNVIIVDDGIATGYTLLATIQMLRKQQPAKIIVAVPVAPLGGYSRIEQEADEFICLDTPDYFPGVGAFYKDFEQVEDETVIGLLNKS